MLFKQCILYEESDTPLGVLWSECVAMIVQAVKTYTHCLKDIDEGRLEKWQTLSPPEFSRYYWGLGEDATMRDLIMAVRCFWNTHNTELQW